MGGLVKSPVASFKISAEDFTDPLERTIHVHPFGTLRSVGAQGTSFQITVPEGCAAGSTLQADPEGEKQGQWGRTSKSKCV